MFYDASKASGTGTSASVSSTSSSVPLASTPSVPSAASRSRMVPFVSLPLRTTSLHSRTASSPATGGVSLAGTDVVLAMNAAFKKNSKVWIFVYSD